MSEKKSQKTPKPKKITVKQQRFVDEWLIDLNATQAYKRAYGVSQKVAEASGPRLLGNVRVQLAIQEAMKAREERTQITQDKVLYELALSAFLRVQDIVKPDGKIKGLHEMSPETAQAFGNINLVQTDEGVACQVRSVDKLKSLELVGKHLNMFKEQEKPKQPIEVNVNLHKEESGVRIDALVAKQQALKDAEQRSH